jgi:hypothetical protein
MSQRSLPSCEHVGPPSELLPRRAAARAPLERASGSAGLPPSARSARAGFVAEARLRLEIRRDAGQKRDRAEYAASTRGPDATVHEGAFPAYEGSTRRCIDVGASNRRPPDSGYTTVRWSARQLKSRHVCVASYLSVAKAENGEMNIWARICRLDHND